MQMLLIVAITGGAGFVSSYFMLHRGLHSMAIRYPIALSIAYVVFLFLLWLWLRTSTDNYGGDFSGISNFPTPSISDSGTAVDGIGSNGSGGHVADATLRAIFQLEEFALPVIVFIVISAMLVISAWAVYIAPSLFAELLIDGVLSASLYRKMRGLETHHWLGTAIRRTIWPLVLTTFVLAFSGWVMQIYAPKAQTLGDVMHYMKTKRK
ncbi:MAG TPA: hypothetical protein VIF82_04445 [Burkholderiaceae bacterium]